jgi:hypothetical protein
MNIINAQQQRFTVGHAENYSQASGKKSGTLR